MTDRNAIVGSVLTAAGILSATVMTSLAIGCDHLDRQFSDLRSDIREIRTLLIDHLNEHAETD